MVTPSGCVAIDLGKGFEDCVAFFNIKLACVLVDGDEGYREVFFFGKQREVRKGIVEGFALGKDFQNGVENLLRLRVGVHKGFFGEGRVHGSRINNHATAFDCV